MNTNEKLLTLIDNEWETLMKNYPELATLMGEQKYNDKLSDLSEEAILNRKINMQKTLEELKTMNQSELTDENKLNFLLFKDKLENDIKEIDFKGYLMPINQMMGVQEEFSRLIEMMPYKNEKDFENYLARLKAFPNYIDQLIELMKKGLQSGHTVPSPAIIKVVEQLNAQVPDNYKTSVYYAPLNSNIPSEELKKSLEVAIQQELYPAFRKLSLFIEKEYVPNTRTKEGLSEVPNGKAYYDHKLKTMTTTDLTAEEIHEIGNKEVARLEKELYKIYETVGFEGSYSEFMHDLKTNPKFYFSSPQELMMSYRDVAKRADKELPKLFKVLPRLPYGVEEIPVHQAPSYPTAYYLPPDLTMTRAGIFYANTSELNTRPKYEMEALTLHEAVPGHHLQIALSFELSNIPKFRRMAELTGYIEGWGLYSEKLGEDMGFYKDVYAKFGQLSFEMWRACRLVIDTGLHALGWSREKAIKYLQEKTGKSEDACTVEVDRYISIPAQATAYKIGELKILELREKFIEKRSKDFDVREFHDVILRNGALPLSILEDYVNEYLNSN